MALNLVQAGGAAGVGILSGVLEPPTVAPINIGGQSIPVSLIAEAGAVIVGTGAQFLMPYTMPSLMDGLVDGGLALLARRVTTMVKGAAAPMYAPMATRVGSGAAAFAMGAGRGLAASSVGSNKYQFV